ncbi:MAG: hypothetical protein JSV33_04485 [bacterium]|nr:MAG: hypothetical protein JSV33_04485 [bacterium]
MDNRLLRTVVSGAAVIALAANAYAFDGKRKGFILGFGMGGGVSHISSRIGAARDSATRGGPGVDVRIGYARTDRWHIFFGGKMNFCYLDEIIENYDAYFDAMSGEGLKSAAAIIFAPVVLPFIPIGGAHSVIGLVGVSYYLDDAAPSFFFEATLGASIFPDEFADEARGGGGFSLAAGYEFEKRWSFRCDVMVGIYRPQETDYDTEDERANAVTVMLTANYLYY